MKLLAFIALTTCTSTQDEMRFLQDSTGKSWYESLETAQPVGESCDGFYRITDPEGYGFSKLETFMTIDEYRAMDNKAKVEWMEANAYDPSKNTCPASKSCSIWMKSAKNDQGELVENAVTMQTCQECYFEWGFDMIFYDGDLDPLGLNPDFESMT